MIQIRFRHAFLILIICIAPFTAKGQSLSQNDRSAFQEAIRSEIARVPQGQWLYQHCEVFARATSRRAEQRLGISETIGLQDNDPNEILSTDTSIEGDISKSTAQQNETNLAIDRKNPNIIIAGANDNNMFTLNMPAYVTTNAGRSWKTNRLPSWGLNDCQEYGDPMLISDNDGTFYYAFLLLSNDGVPPLVSDICVATSADGKNWSLSSVIGRTDPSDTLEDKEAIAIDNDPKSPYYHRIYVTWIRYAYDGSDYLKDHFVSWSDDRGKTWSTPNLLDFGLGKFSTIHVGAGGVVFISSTSNDEQASTLTHEFLVSHDGGLTFVDHPLADVENYDINSDGRPGLKGQDGFRSFPYVAFDIEKPGTGSVKNILHVVYGSLDDTSDYAVNNGSVASEYYVQSSDEGVTWTVPTLIGTHSTASNDHFLPWLSFDELHRIPYATMYSSEDDPNNIKVRAVRIDLTSNRATPLDGNLFDPIQILGNGGGPFIGDYIGSDAAGGVFAASWTQNKTNSKTVGNVYAYVSSPLGTATVNPVAEERSEMSEPVPNPCTIHTQFDISSSVAGQFKLFDLRGIEVFSQVITPEDHQTIAIDTHVLAAGVYRAVLQTGSVTSERELVILH